MSPIGTVSVTIRPDFSGFMAALRTVGRAAASTRRHFNQLNMSHTLTDLDDLATATKACPSFPYDGDLDELDRLAPAASGRFRLRREIENMRTRLGCP